MAYRQTHKIKPQNKIHWDHNQNKICCGNVSQTEENLIQMH